MYRAVQVVSGEVQLEAYEAGGSSATTWQEAEQAVRKAAGMGPFTAANMLQLMGYYARIPCDSETMRHLKKHHGVTSCPQGGLQEKAQQVIFDLVAQFSVVLQDMSCWTFSGTSRSQHLCCLQLPC